MKLRVAKKVLRRGWECTATDYPYKDTTLERALNRLWRRPAVPVRIVVYDDDKEETR